MNSFHEFEGSKARIEKEGENFMPNVSVGGAAVLLIRVKRL